MLDANTQTLLILLVTGAVSGWLAGSLLKAKTKYGLFMDVIIGILGANVGSWLWGEFQIPYFNTSSWLDNLVVAFAGACALIIVIKIIVKIYTAR